MRWLDGITDSMDMGLSELWEFDDGQGGLACCDSWDHKGSDTTERLNWTEQSPSAVILEPAKIKYDTVSTVSPSICQEVMGPDAMIFVF